MAMLNNQMVILLAARVRGAGPPFPPGEVSASKVGSSDEPGGSKKTAATDNCLCCGQAELCHTVQK